LVFILERKMSMGKPRVKIMNTEGSIKVKWGYGVEVS